MTSSQAAHQQGSREGARDEMAASLAGLHVLPARHGPRCPVASDPEGQHKTVPAPPLPMISANALLQLSGLSQAAAQVW